jgi:hypothetical protein
LYLVITGTPAFFDGSKGIQQSAPLAQRLAVDFSGDPRFDATRAPQIRLTGLDQGKLVMLGCVVRDLYAQGVAAEARIKTLVDDDYVEELALAVAGRLGGRIGTSPRVFLRKLVAEVLYRVDEHPDFDPRRDYRLTVQDTELTDEERNAAREGRWARSAADVELDV